MKDKSNNNKKNAYTRKTRCSTPYHWGCLVILNTSGQIRIPVLKPDRQGACSCRELIMAQGLKTINLPSNTVFNIVD